MTPMIGQVDLLLRGLAASRYTLEQLEWRLRCIRAVMIRYIKRATTLRDVGGAVGLAREAGDKVDELRLLVGVRVWF